MHDTSPANFSPNGFNFEQSKDDKFDTDLTTLADATHAKVIDSADTAAHEQLIDIRPGYDLNPRAMNPKVKVFVSPKSWFVDLTLVSVQ